MARRGEETDYGFPPARGGRGAPSMFPRKLYQILCETDPAVVGWDDDGESFHIANMELFVESVMPLYYRHNKLTSFQRQLNLYGFKKRGRDERHAGHYYHPFFQRDHPEILGDVRRSYPAGNASSRSEEDEVHMPSGNSTPHVRPAFSCAMSSPSRRSRNGSDSRRKAAVCLRPTLENKPSPPMLPQQRSRRIHNVNNGGVVKDRDRDRDRGAGGGGGDTYVQSYAYRQEKRTGERAPEAGKNSAKRPWSYSRSPEASEAAISARHDGSETTRNESTTTYRVRHDGDEGWSGASGTRGGAGTGGGADAGGGSYASNDRSEARNTQSPTHGRMWGLNRGSEEYRGYIWYNPEEPGISRLAFGESICSPWGDMHAPPGDSNFFDRNRARAMAMAAGSPRANVETDRRSSYPSSGGGVGRPLSAYPVPRGVRTSAVFPSRLLRHERFSSYTNPRYPSPPVSAHAAPGSNDLSHRKPSKWRPVYDESRISAGGDAGDGIDGGGSSWNDQPRFAMGVRMPQGRDDRNKMAEMVLPVTQERSRDDVGAGGEPRSQPAHDSQGPSGSASSSPYRVAFEDPRGGNVSESFRPNGFRYGMPEVRPASASPAAKGDAVSSHAIAMAATT